MSQHKLLVALFYLHTILVLITSPNPFKSWFRLMQTNIVFLIAFLIMQILTIFTRLIPMRSLCTSFNCRAENFLKPNVASRNFAFQVNNDQPILTPADRWRRLPSFWGASQLCVARHRVVVIAVKTHCSTKRGEVVVVVMESVEHVRNFTFVFVDIWKKDVKMIEILVTNSTASTSKHVYIYIDLQDTCNHPTNDPFHCQTHPSKLKLVTTGNFSVTLDIKKRSSYRHSIGYDYIKTNLLAWLPKIDAVCRGTYNQWQLCFPLHKSWDLLVFSQSF